MAVFELNDEDTWLPIGARGQGTRALHVRLHHGDGSRPQVTIPAPPAPREITVTDPRAIRHLDADPRFTRIS